MSEFLQHIRRHRYRWSYCQLVCNLLCSHIRKNQLRLDTVVALPSTDLLERGRKLQFQKDQRKNLSDPYLETLVYVLTEGSDPPKVYLSVKNIVNSLTGQGLEENLSFFVSIFLDFSTSGQSESQFKTLPAQLIPDPFVFQDQRKSERKNHQRYRSIPRAAGRLK